MQVIGRFAAVVFSMLMFALPGAVCAQTYPAKPVRVIISFPPGSSTDIVGRVVAQKLSEYWGQPVLAENRGGAGGTIAAAAVAKAPPDGYTLLIDSSAHSVSPAIYAKLPYDTLKDFVDIAPLAGQPNVLVSLPGTLTKSVADLVADAKARPGKINFASAGIGSGTHLNLEKFKLLTGADVTHIPYKGTQEVITDLLGGRVEYYFAPISAALANIRDGKLRALADPGVRERLAKLGNDPMSMTPAEFSQFVRREVEDYARVTKAAGIVPQ